MAKETKNLAELELITIAGLVAPGFLVWLETNFFGKILKPIVIGVIARWQARGVTLINVGIERVAALYDSKEYDATFESAIKAVEDANGSLTPEKAKEIDDKVIAAFDKFSDMRGTKLLKRRDP